MADARIYLPSQPLLPQMPAAKQLASQKNAPSFAAELEKAKSEVSFSAHATERMRARGIDLSDEELSRLGDAVNKMASKGARESLIYMNDVALVVSIRNRTVITAMDGMSAKDNIFTNIDSAAIL
ncbi:TIGR02530 family flagellar biosynthesis protein [Selenomonas sp. CM52]|uniref:TIGR02530 family flagellar biosynthesis protein n=1 Tax=Selenomonas sp. CM52 TaxID=936381 RepID=UPI00027C5A17|nr:TIGR02530 family flagellar biosynthesis protein [Selenomonas sp. CM52]EJU30919.1 flagellar operon protein [Selenomonas sp. CM52]